ncbi:RNA polymerase sigma factor [Enterococcus sp. AZ126]|uniref:RNA polymerase sigma factor n=1 Tax=Enterococcus sp. AZ126 TaxID=2774635 RepID=UPI003F28D15E
MKKDVTFEESLLLLGQEVIGSLIKKGSTMEDAEDAVSQTYNSLFSSLMYITQENLRPWFFRVSFNNYIDLFRKKKREKAYVSDYLGIQPELISESQNFWMIIDPLKKEEQELLILKYYYELSYESIAVMLDLNIETVKKKLYRTRKKLKDIWED